MRQAFDNLVVGADPVELPLDVVDERWHASDSSAGDTRDTDAAAEGLRRRICDALRGKSVRVIASETGFCAETVRRYLRTSKCSVEFVATLCTRYGLSAEWLLFGRGSPDYEDQAKSVLAQASFGSLLSELARRWERLDDAVRRAEHTLDKASPAKAPSSAPLSPSTSRTRGAGSALATHESRSTLCDLPRSSIASRKPQ